MKIALKNVLPNPFRDMDHYPINKQKIEALKLSIQDTDFWDNIVARKIGNKVEIAYGHHRLHALRALYPGTHEINLITRPLSDEKMLKIMAHENMEEWGHVSDIERETIRAVVKAFHENKIVLPPVKAGHERIAPSFCIEGSARPDDPSYTAESIASFLQWKVTPTKYVLRALCLIQQRHLKEKQLKSLSSYQAMQVVDETMKAVRQAKQIQKEAKRKAMDAKPARAKAIEAKAKETAKSLIAETAINVSGAIQKGASISEAKSKGLEARAKIHKGKDKLPEIDSAALAVARSIRGYLDPEGATGSKLSELIKFKKHMSSNTINELTVALKIIAEYANGYKSKLK